MQPMKLSELVETFDGVSWLSGREDSNKASVLRVSTDSRQVREGDCFFAIKGERFDAHDFVNEAAARGAAVAVVEHEVKAPGGFPIVKVGNTINALQQLALFYRGLLPLPLVAVAGSNGKTSTKEFTAAVLSVRGKTAKTLGNLNNHLGVPLTLLDIDWDHYAAVIEIGTNHPGEVAFLTKLVRPQVGIVTNIGLEHLEFLKDEAGVAQEEGSLLTEMGNEGTAILNADDRWFEFLKQKALGKILTAGFSESADVRLNIISESNTSQTFVATFQEQNQGFELPWVGRHLVSNAGLAIAAGLALGISLEEMKGSLEKVELPSGRMKLVQAKGFQIIDDTYNANPSSMQAALRYLASQKGGRRLAVLGDMGELGEEQSYWHQWVGCEAANLAIDQVVAIGKEASSYAKGIEKRVPIACFDEAQLAIDYLKEIIDEGDIILIKASRSSRLERVVNALTQDVLTEGELC